MSDEQKKLEDLLKQLQLNNGNGPKINAEPVRGTNDFKFWKTQPVTSLEEEVTEEGPIDKPKKPEDISDKTLPMLAEFEWTTVDIEDNEQLEDVFVLLNENYVEDRDSEFRFNYTKEFFKWALKCPGWNKDWNVGVRVKNTGKLIAFISAIPVTLRVRSNIIKSVEINFLCVHKQLRAKRLAPVLIKEITRRVNKTDIWQALYTGGAILPSPIATCRYTHRPLNWNKLCDVGFTALPSNSTNAEMVAKYTLPKVTATPGLRVMEEKDIEETLRLFNRYQERFELVQNFTKEEFHHWFLGGLDSTSSKDSNVIYSYVIEDKDGKITDFFSFYSLPFSILNHSVHKDLGIGYLFYYASDADFNYAERYNEEATSKLKKRLDLIIRDACILANNSKMDVFNALTSQDNALFLDDLKFGSGDGFLNFYLFNYKAFPIHGGLLSNKSNDVEKRSNLGIVML
ncbi:hypothetical protein Kpol_530p24 [Vanderwaltozyma polyspora DSM 70294]|uniref:Glycylpeptide N-tetradecanoyltransferase n=1 Tax=Vanderwaltozyma polyspora (strain ATCC 22028 / DSM 70294 / BCRC 21397 / CBS 2163 / NBRC 10782 / NRRL Y-8283 / UCD 57-17) TaxID=436907 RepID=A7TKZ8_VANPO|nr:uncharacterized protein Kpol_530p24 [Vanderwaltozyma polyspora DSM 70294]EDO17054.1 hypothetical protein Kpol_530p24 [Vanderwaltozyma polyspora DSM 70294]